MSRPRRPGPAKGHGLGAEDAELWEHVARTITPARRRKGRVSEPLERLAADSGDGPLPPPSAQPSERVKPPAAPVARPQQPQAEPRTRGWVKPSPPPRPPAPSAQGARKAMPADIDSHTARRIVSGREEITSTIDLHGMTQREAHAALVGFLRRAHAQGHRTVLVITGKGGPRLTSDAAQGWQGGFPHHAPDRERGVLRRNVPHWLESPELSAIVVGYRAAAIAHGGEGAMYVRLRAHKKG